MRPGDEDAVDVEFLDGPDLAAGADEQLDTSGAGRSSPGRRVFTLVAVAALIAALVVRTATSHDSAHTAAPPAPPNTASARPVPAVPPAWATPAPSGGEQNVSVLNARTGWVVRTFVIPDVPADACPSDGCVVGTALPDGFVAAVRARLHIATPAQQVAVTSAASDRVAYRRLVAAGPDRTTVTVTVARQSGRGPATTTVKLTSTRVTGSVSVPLDRAGLVVTVVVAGPSGWSPPIAAMRALAGDSRLLVAG